MSKMIEYKRPDGRSSAAYYAAPTAGDDAPGVVVIQEWWGLDDEIKAAADRLAAAGYRVLVPDLYGGRVAMEAKEAEHLMHGLDFTAAAAQDIRGAVQHLKATGSARAGVMGYCMGGALTVLAAVFAPESDANVTWYGYPPLETLDASRIKAPLQGHFATEDAFFPIDGVDRLEKRLTEAGVPHEFHRYHARHAFANPKSDARGIPALGYDPQAAALAWERTLAFFGRHLR